MGWFFDCLEVHQKGGAGDRPFVTIKSGSLGYPPVFTRGLYIYIYIYIINIRYISLISYIYTRYLYITYIYILYILYLLLIIFIYIYIPYISVCVSPGDRNGSRCVSDCLRPRPR